MCYICLIFQLSIMNELSNNILLINSVIFYLLNAFLAIIFLNFLYQYKLKPTFIKIVNTIKRLVKK